MKNVIYTSSISANLRLGFTLNIGWLLAEDDEAVYQIMKETMARVEEYTKSHQVYDPFLFLNDAFASQNPFAGYGDSRYNMLKAASKKYDPHGVFQRLVPGGFKL